MKLNNIHNRKDFVKIHESEWSGGVSASGEDGFANNAKLKDTVLGAVINGLFKGISWLWRKSNEYFVINRLKAKLINELMRGIIIYCFDNNVNLQTGEKLAENNEEGSETQPETIPEPIPEPHEFEVIKNDTVTEPSLVNFDSSNPSKEILKDVNIPIKTDKIVKPNDRSYYANIAAEMEDFLKNNIENYNDKSPEEKKKIKIIYVNYKIVQSVIDKLKKQEIQKESYLYEATETPDEVAGLVKHKLDTPEAGRTTIGVETSATVGDILTKRDRDKYKEHGDDFSLNLNSINLAEIEKTIERTNDQSKVSTYVNPENLKVIQMTAKQLFVPLTTDDAKTKLQLRWNKELTSIYASFVNIMDINKDVDIRGDYRTDLESSIKQRVDNSVKKFGNEKKTLEVTEKMDDKLIENKDIKFSELKGRFSFLSFSIKNILFFGAIQDMFLFTGRNKKQQTYLIKVSNTFDETIDIPNKKLVSTFDTFKNQCAQNNKTSSGKMNVFFLFKNPQMKSVDVNTRMILINEDANTHILYLCRYENGQIISIKVSDVTDSTKIAEWITDIKLIKLRAFLETGQLTDEWKDKFNFKVDYQRNEPKFLEKGVSVEDKLKILLDKF